ncbi:MAG: OmpA family protein [Bacteroidota bacterium]
MSLTILLFSLSCSLLAQSAPKGAQPNIVPNPGFEKFSATPIGWFYKGRHFTEVMKYWSSPTAASPDVFGPRVRVPEQWSVKGFGQHRAHGGSSMVGITVYGCEHGKPHCREYLQIQLGEPLVVGQLYYVEFYVSSLPRSLLINNIGMAFAKQKVDELIDVQLELKPMVNADHILTGQSGAWTKISGTFEATEESEYLLIGNFFSDQSTKVRESRSDHLNYAYYYIDDILVRKKEPIIDVPVREDDLTKVHIERGKVIQLRNIFFDSDKAELLPRSYIELNKLVQLMQRNPNMVIEVAGHTDSVGDHLYNISLSQNRARAVATYLIRHGIDPKRTHYKGFGSTSPIASNDTEAGRQMNRRVEFLVIQL